MKDKKSEPFLSRLTNRLSPAVIATLYALISGLWIIISDQIVDMISPDPDTITKLQTYKGWFFVVMTSLLIYGLIRLYGKRLTETAFMLRGSEERYRALTKASSEVLYQMSADWSEMKQLRGGGFLADTSNPNRNWLQDYIHQDDQNWVLSEIGEAVRNGTIFELEHRVRRVDGTWGWTHSRAVPVRNSDGEIIEWFGAAGDITRRKEAEQQLKVGKQLSDVLNTINTHLLSTRDINETIHRVIEESVKAVGADSGILYVPRENHWVAKYVYGFPGLEGARLTEDDLKFSIIAIRENRAILANELGGKEGQCPLFLKDFGVRSILDAPLLTANNVVGDLALYSCTSADAFTYEHIDFVTKLGASVSMAVQTADFLDQMRATRDELETTNKELEAFAHSASHDLRAPLRIIRSFSEIIIDEYSSALEEEPRKFLSIIYESSAKMEELVADFLSLAQSGRQELHMSSFDMEELARNVFSEISSSAAERDVHFSVKKLPQAYGDPSLIRQVLTNLIGNAMKFTRKKEVAEIEFGSLAEGNYNVYFVKDNGMGFDMKFADKLFEPFQRLHGETEFVGTGLGLSIVHRIISRHGGRVWAEGGIGNGATFYFTLQTKETAPPS